MNRSLAKARLAWALAAGAVPAVAESPSHSPVDVGFLQGMGDVRYERVWARPLEQTFHVYVRLPEGYAESETSYPTVYLLDGGITFPLLAGYYHYLRLGGELPELILVGISYGSDDWQKGNHRSRDFTAAAAERDFWGGATAFEAVLRHQIVPGIEARYRSDPKRRLVFGQSLGGQFVLHAALVAPDLFWGGIASNPALHRNLDFFLTTSPTAAGSERRLFVSSGEDDHPDFRGPALRWMQYWEGRKAPWALKTATLPGQTHFSAAPEAFRRGLGWLFPKP